MDMGVVEMAERVCPRCGKSVLATDVDCMSCGAKLNAQAAPRRTVPASSAGGPGRMIGRVFGRQMGGDNVQIIVTTGAVYIADVLLNAPGYMQLLGFAMAFGGIVVGGLLGLLVNVLIAAPTDRVFPSLVYYLVVAMGSAGFGVGWSMISRVACATTSTNIPHLKGAKSVPIAKISLEREGRSLYLTAPYAFGGQDAVRMGKRDVEELTKVLRKALGDPSYTIPVAYVS